MLSRYIKFPFTGPIREYTNFTSDVYNFIKLKIFLKGPIFIEKDILEVDPIFAVS